MPGFPHTPWLGVEDVPVPSVTVTANGDTGPLTGYGPAQTLRAQLNVTAITGTLDVVIEDSVDGGATWNTVATFTQATAVSRQVLNVTSPFGSRLRVRWTVGGATPSVTFAVHWVAQN